MIEPKKDGTKNVISIINNSDDKNEKTFILNILCNFFALCLLYLIPLFILYAMGEFNVINAGIAIVTSAYVMIIGSFVPIPGVSLSPTTFTSTISEPFIITVTVTSPPKPAAVAV